MRTRTVQEKLAINRILGNNGLPTLDASPGDVSRALAFLVNDHDHFKSILIRCDPDMRRDMYDAMKPHLQFKAKPLDVYVAEAAIAAEARGLAKLDADGKYQWPAVQDIRTVPVDADVAAAQDAVNAEFAKKFLMVTCRKCTKEAAFTGDTKGDCIFNARRAGWAYWERPDGTAGEICPDCENV